jgi:hypothetical protein
MDTRLGAHHWIMLTVILDLKLKNIPLYALPAALAFGYELSCFVKYVFGSLTLTRFGSVFMICAVGVYV